MFTGAQVSDMIDKKQRGEDLGAGDWTKLGTNVLTMIPFIGSVAALADAAGELGGTYGVLNQLSGDDLTKALTLRAHQIPADHLTGALDRANEKGEAGLLPLLLDWLKKKQQEDTQPGNIADATKEVASNTSALVEHMDQQRQEQILKGGTLPVGGDFNRTSLANNAASYTRTQGVDETKTKRPSLDSKGGTSTEQGANVDPSSYNDGEDSVMVKFNGFGALQAMFKRREASMSTTT